LIARWKARALFAPVNPEAIGHFRIIRPSARKCGDGQWVRLPNMSLTLPPNCNVHLAIRDDGQMDMHENRKNFLQKMCIDANFTAASGDAQGPDSAKIRCRGGKHVIAMPPVLSSPRDRRIHGKSPRRRIAVIFAAIEPPAIKRWPYPASLHRPGVYWPLASHSLSFCGFTACCAGFLRGFF
jgi:hypothetical protein